MNNMKIYPPTLAERCEKPYYVKEWDKHKKYSIYRVQKYIDEIEKRCHQLMFEENDTITGIYLMLYRDTLQEAIAQAKRAGKDIIDGRLYRLDIIETYNI